MEQPTPAASETPSTGSLSSSASNEFLPSLIAIFILVDLFAIPLVAAVAGGGVGGTFLAMCGISGLVAQFALLSVWGVLGNQRLVVRLPFCLLAATSLYVVTSLGTIGVHMEMVHEIRGLLAGALLIPLMVLILQAPIWLLRAFLDWARFDPQGNELSQARASRQFGLQEMLVLTAIVAVALGLAQVFAKWSLAAGGVPADESARLTILASPAILMMVLSLFLLLPCLTACLVVQNVKTGRIVLAVYGAIVVVGMTIFAGVAGAPPEAIVYAFFFTAAVVGVPLLVVAVTLSAVRASGYRLVRRRKHHLSHSQDGRAAGSPFAAPLEAIASDPADDSFAEGHPPKK